MFGRTDIVHERCYDPNLTIRVINRGLMTDWDDAGIF